MGKLTGARYLYALSLTPDGDIRRHAGLGYVLPGSLTSSTEAIEETARDHTRLHLSHRDAFGAHRVPAA
ncbi:hypothetical protein AB0P17_24670 [Streptomyces sp. NPDC088124]|uniref:hypothetical protein n=1 Tax=Streptomyces sp. NPDC088124 TaxID=3154654 RepID=UPI00342E9029